MVASVLWGIRKARNAAIFRHKPPDQSEVVETALPMLRSFHTWSLPTSKPEIEEGNASCTWKPPKARTFKMSISGASVPGTTEGLVALVCRDYAGHLLCGAAKSVAAILPLVVEALALEDALNDVLSPQNEENGALFHFFSPLHNVIEVETDCLVLVNGLMCPRQLTWEAYVPIGECKEVLLTLPKIHVLHCPKEANSVADWIAKIH